MENNMNYNAQQPPYGVKMEPPVSIGDFFGTMIVMAIPLVNLIMLIVWLASSNTKQSKKNFLIANLIFVIIAVVIVIVASAVLGVSMLSMMGDLF